MINEHIIFSDFNSENEGYYILERNAPTPTEKEIVDSVPFMNGVFDFSDIVGERFFNNRQITYKLLMPNVSYDIRKVFEQRAKIKLMKPFKEKLFDSHDSGYYWLGKCKSVTAKDDQQKRDLELNIIFDVYPYALKSQTWVDLWDDFNFERDIAQKLIYTVKNNQAIKLYNSGDNRISPKVITDKPITILTADSTAHYFNSNVKEDFSFYLKPGKNNLIIWGDNARVEFDIVTEEML